MFLWLPALLRCAPRTFSCLLWPKPRQSFTLLECGGHVWRNETMKHSLGCSTTHRDYYIFCTVSLLTFTSHCYWHGEHPQNIAIVITRFLVMMTTMLTVTHKSRMTLRWLHESNQQIAPIDAVDPSAPPKQNGPSGRPQSDLCCNRPGPREGKHWKYLGFDMVMLWRDSYVDSKFWYGTNDVGCRGCFLQVFVCLFRFVWLGAAISPAVPLRLLLSKTSDSRLRRAVISVLSVIGKNQKGQKDYMINMFTSYCTISSMG